MRRLTSGAAALIVLAAVAMVVLSKGWLPIPPGGGFLFVPGFMGAPAQANPMASFEIPQHPHLAANGRNSMHNDAYATDSYAGPGPIGRGTRVTSAFYGLSECATLTFDRAGRLVGLCGGVLGPQLKLIDPVSLRVLASHRLPGRVLRAGVSPLEDLCGGSYFYLDNEDRAVVATTNRQIRVIGPSPGLATHRVYDLASVVPVEDCLIALMPDWSGRIWFVTSGGVVGAVNPATGAAKTVALPGERVANSFAVDETGGVFIVSDHALYRFDADEGAAPVVTWRREYDRGVRRKPSQLSQGSGTTPTLLGGERVAITDNAEPRMNVLVYGRGEGELVCQTSVFAPGASATENSIVAVGDSLLVENNFGYTGPATKEYTAGVARVDVVDGRCVNAWENAERAPSSVPKVSLATGLMYVYTRPSEVDISGWYLSAIDVRTGKTVFRVRSGVGVQWNNHYAAVTLGPDGAAYIATLTGLIRIADG